MKKGLQLRSTCALCLKATKLCRSHIIPNSLYRPIFKSDGHAMVKSALTRVGPRKVQTGYAEHLLCEACEQRFSVWEAYALRVLFGGEEALQARRVVAIPETVEYRGIDYTKFKLFQMSVLWRASVASHRFFKQVDLGPREDELRQMLVAADPGEVSDFGCLMARLTLNNEPMVQAVIEPTCGRLRHRRKYRFIFGSILWEYSVSKLQDTAVAPLMLQKSGGQTLMTIAVTDLESINQMMASIIKKESWQRYKALVGKGSVLR